MGVGRLVMAAEEMLVAEGMPPYVTMIAEAVVAGDLPVRSVQSQQLAVVAENLGRTSTRRVRYDEVLLAEEMPEAMYALDDTSTTPTFYIDASCNIYGAVDLADLPIDPPAGRITKQDAE